jgi:hypothetical protein
MVDHAQHVTVRPGHPVRRESRVPGWWPPAGDGGGNQLVVDTDPPDGGTVGQIVVAGPDEDERRVLAPGIAEYLRAAADLEAGEVGDGVRVDVRADRRPVRHLVGRRRSAVSGPSGAGRRPVAVRVAVRWPAGPAATAVRTGRSGS